MDTLHPGWEVKVFDSTVGRLNRIEFQAKQRAALAPSPGVSEMCVCVCLGFFSCRHGHMDQIQIYVLFCVVRSVARYRGFYAR